MRRDDLITELRVGLESLLQHFDSPEEQLAKCYAPGKWSVRAILCHLADCEMANLWRFTRAVAEPGSLVHGFEENQWAEALDYSHRAVEPSRHLYLGARATLINHVQTLPDAILGRSCVHPEKGPMTGWQWAELTVAHGAHHLTQIVAARSGKPWVKTERPDAWKYGAGPKPRG